MKITSIRLLHLFGFLLPIWGGIPYAQAMPENSLTIAFVPDFISTAAPLDESMLFKLSCVLSTSDVGEIDKVRAALISYSVQSSASAPSIDFRQGIILSRGTERTEFYFKMPRGKDDAYLVKKKRDGKEFGMQVDTGSWNNFFRSLDIRKYTTVINPSGYGCESFGIFFNKYN